MSCFASKKFLIIYSKIRNLKFPLFAALSIIAKKNLGNGYEVSKIEKNCLNLALTFASLSYYREVLGDALSRTMSNT